MHTRRGLDVGQESSHPCCAFIPEVKKERVSPWWKIGVKKFLSTTCETALSPNDRVTWHLRAKSSSSITFATRISLRAFSYFYLITFFSMTIKTPMKSKWRIDMCFVLQPFRPPRRRSWTHWMRSTRVNGPDTICCTCRHKILTCCGKISLTNSRTRFLYHSTHIKVNSRRWGYVSCNSR